MVLARAGGHGAAFDPLAVRATTMPAAPSARTTANPSTHPAATVRQVRAEGSGSDSAGSDSGAAPDADPCEVPAALWTSAGATAAWRCLASPSKGTSLPFHVRRRYRQRGHWSFLCSEVAKQWPQPAHMMHRIDRRHAAQTATMAGASTGSLTRQFGQSTGTRRGAGWLGRMECSP